MIVHVCTYINTYIYYMHMALMSLPRPTGSPLVQSCGLQCLHAHFANCKPRELLWINGNMHGRKMRSHKKPSSVEPLITELSRFNEEPSLHVQSTSKGQSGEACYSGSLRTGSGSLKTFLEAMSDVAESYNEELVSWQKKYALARAHPRFHVILFQLYYKSLY